MGKRQETAAETRQKLLDAAKSLGKENGFKDVMVEDITEKAGVAKGTFYTYFKRKEDIISEIAFEGFEVIRKQLESSEKDIVEKLADFLSMSMDLIVDDSLAVAQQWMKNAMQPADGESQAMMKYRYDMEYVAGCLYSAVEAAELTEEMPVEKVAEQIVAQYYGMVAVWCLTDGKLEAQELMRFFCRDSLEEIIKRYRRE